MTDRDLYDFVVYRQLRRPWAWKWLYDPIRLITGQRFTGSKRAEEVAEALNRRDADLAEKEKKRQMTLGMSGEAQ